MKIDVTWDDEDETIIRYTFLQGWTINDFYEVYDIASDMVRGASHRVIGVIVDDTQGTVPPPDALTAYRRTVSKGKLPMVIVGSGHMSRILMKVAETAASTGERQILYTKTLAEARQALQNMAAENTDR